MTVAVCANLMPSVDNRCNLPGKGFDRMARNEPTYADILLGKQVQQPRNADFASENATLDIGG